MNPVIVLTLFRRPEMTRQILAALDACYNSAAAPVYLSVDYAPECRAACNEVYRIACDWAAKRNTKRANPWDARNTTVVRHDPNLGIDLHKLKAIPGALAWSGADAFIFGEDDTPFAPDALNFFCTLLARTADEPDTLAVCGYNRQESVAEWESVKDQPYGVWRGFGPDFSSWGWAMTRAQWERFFGDGGARYCREVDIPNGRFDWWLVSLGLQIIRPLVSRTNHTGGEDATHTPSMEFLMAREFSRWTAADLDLPDNGLFTWDGAN